MESDVITTNSVEQNIVLACNISYLINENNWFEIDIRLKSFYKRLLLKKQNFSVTIEEVESMLNIIDIINSQFGWYNTLEVPLPNVLTETLKILRVFVTKEYVAKYLIENEKFYTILHQLMNCIFTKKNGQELYTKYLFQMIINLLTVGKDNNSDIIQTKILSHFIEKIKNYFIENYGCLYEVSAVLYNLFLNKEITDINLINSVIVNVGNNNIILNEYLDFLLEEICEQDHLWNIYDHLPLKSRLLVLEYLNEILVAPDKNLKDNLPVSCIARLLEVFNASANVVFQVTQPGCVDSSQEVSYILQILSVLSANEKYLNNLQANVDLFINAGVLLINIHKLGKTPENVFKPIQKLSEIQNPGRDIWNNPVFGFKASLIRLIGNLCWKNKRIQDLARQAEIIPVVLDCCNIDAKNPFIMQWVILAIRNICENNPSNQAIIAGLTQQGVVHSELLQEFGISSYTEELLSNRIVNLDLNNSR